MGYPMVEGYPLVFTRNNYFYWNKPEKIFLGGKGGPRPPVSARSTEMGARVLSPPNIWSRSPTVTKRRKTAQNGAKWRKTAQNGAKRCKTAQNGARRRKRRSVRIGSIPRAAQDGTRRCKTAQNGARRRKMAQNGAKRRKMRKAAQNRRYPRGTKLGGGKSLDPFLKQSLSKIRGPRPPFPPENIFSGFFLGTVCMLLLRTLVLYAA